MLSFECIRAYSSIGTADLIFSPSWNYKKNSRTLLVQCKNQRNDDYLKPFERAHIDNLQQRNAGMVIIAFKRSTKCFIKIWESNITQSFEEFILSQYGISCEYSKLIKMYNQHKRPIHLYPPEKEEYVKKDGSMGGKFIAPFADLLSLDVWYPHVGEHFNEAFKNKK